jgi:hypothetical protein
LFDSNFLSIRKSSHWNNSIFWGDFKSYNLTIILINQLLYKLNFYNIKILLIKPSKLKMFEPIRDGNRGGRDQFKWEDIRLMSYRDREYYHQSYNF